MRHAPRMLFAALLVAAAVAGASAPAAATSHDATSCSFPHTSTDATGTNVTLATEPQRIVTVAPSAAQTVWEIGGAEKVVGVSQHASYLEGAETRTNVSGAGRAWVNTERVVSLEPDLVLVPQAVPNTTVDALRRAGLTAYWLPESSTVEEIQEKTLLVGSLTGECEGAERTASWMEERLSVVREAVEGAERPSALYVFYGFTAGEGTFVDHLLTVAGAENAAAAANITGFERANPEVVVSQDPRWLVTNSGASVPTSAPYNETYAAQHDQTVVLNENHVSQPAPRVVYAVQKLARNFHPEAYAAANVTTTTAPGTETTAPGDESTGTTETTESSGAPGFGAGVALLALLAGAALLARRE